MFTSSFASILLNGRVFWETFPPIYVLLVFLIFGLFKLYLRTLHCGIPRVLLGKKKTNGSHYGMKRNLKTFEHHHDSSDRDPEASSSKPLNVVHRYYQAQRQHRRTYSNKKNRLLASASLLRRGLRSKCTTDHSTVINKSPFAVVDPPGEKRNSHTFSIAQSTTPLYAVNSTEDKRHQKNSADKKTSGCVVFNTDFGMESSWSTPCPVEPSRKHVYGLPLSDPKRMLLDKVYKNSRKGCIVIWSPSENLWETESDCPNVPGTLTYTMARTPHAVPSSQKIMKESGSTSYTRHSDSGSAHRERGPSASGSVYESYIKKRHHVYGLKVNDRSMGRLLNRSVKPTYPKRVEG